MGRKVNQDRLNAVVQTIRKHDNEYRANDVARELNMHPQAVARLLPAIDDHTTELLYENEKGFLGIFKK